MINFWCAFVIIGKYSEKDEIGKSGRLKLLTVCEIYRNAASQNVLPFPNISITLPCLSCGTGLTVLVLAVFVGLPNLSKTLPPFCVTALSNGLVVLLGPRISMTLPVFNVDAALKPPMLGEAIGIDELVEVLA